MVIARKVGIPPNTTKVVTGRMDNSPLGYYVVNPTIGGADIVAPYSLGKSCQSEIPVGVCNFTDQYVVLSCGRELGYAEEVDVGGHHGNS